MPSPNRRLHSVRSSPQLILNEIFEEGESDGENGGASNSSPLTNLRQNTLPSMSAGAASSMSAGAASASPSGGRRHNRLIRARTASCSSTEASDDDEAKSMRAKTIAQQLNKENRADGGTKIPSDISERTNLKLVSNNSNLERASDGNDVSLDRVIVLENDKEALCEVSTNLIGGVSEEEEGCVSHDGVPVVTLSPPVVESSLYHRGPSSRPLTGTCHEPRNSPAKKDTSSSTENMLNSTENMLDSTENMLDIDSTLRESRSLNCIVKASGEEDDTDSHLCSISVSSLMSDSNTVTPTNNISVTNDNVTTIYIGDTDDCSHKDERVVIHVSSNAGDSDMRRYAASHENLFQSGAFEDHWLCGRGKCGSKGGGKEGIANNCRDVVATRDVVLGIVDTPPAPLNHLTHSDPNMPVPGVPYSSSTASPTSSSSPNSGPWVLLPPRPTSHPPTLQHQVKGGGANSLTKSASHMDALVKLKPSKVSSRSATNGSLGATRHHFLMDINQNAGTRKNRSDKSGSSLAIHGSSKCCTVS